MCILSFQVIMALVQWGLDLEILILLIACLKADTNGELDQLTIAYHFQIGLIGIIFILIKLHPLWMRYK